MNTKIAVRDIIVNALEAEKPDDLIGLTEGVIYIYDEKCDQTVEIHLEQYEGNKYW